MLWRQLLLGTWPKSSNDDNSTESGACRHQYDVVEPLCTAPTVLEGIWLASSCCHRHLLTGELGEVDGVVARSEKQQGRLEVEKVRAE